MASKPFKMSDLTESQQRILRVWNRVELTMAAYAAPTVPPMENLTRMGLLDELGDVNEAKKAVEKVEKILKERYKSLLANDNSVKDKKSDRADNYKMTVRTSSRTALNQTAAKETFEKCGNLNLAKLIEWIDEQGFNLPDSCYYKEGTTLSNHMSTGDVEAMYIERL